MLFVVKKELSSMVKICSKIPRLIPKISPGNNFGIPTIYLICLFLFIVISISESCNSVNKNQLSTSKQSKTLSTIPDSCDVELPYPSYQRLESLCNLCASYIRDYPELYGQCR